MNNKRYYVEFLVGIKSKYPTASYEAYICDELLRLVNDCYGDKDDRRTETILRNSGSKSSDAQKTSFLEERQEVRGQKSVKKEVDNQNEEYC